MISNKVKAIAKKIRKPSEKVTKKDHKDSKNFSHGNEKTNHFEILIRNTPERII